MAMRTTVKASRAITERSWFPGTMATLLIFMAFMLQARPLIAVEDAALGLLSRLYSAESQDSVALVTIDDRSVRELGGLTPPRNLMADVIRKVSKGRAKVIAIDELYASTASNPALEEIRIIANEVSEEPDTLKVKAARNVYKSFAAIEKYTDSDKAIIDVMDIRARLVLPIFFHGVGSDMPDYLKDQASSVKMRTFSTSMVMAELKGLKNPFVLMRYPMINSPGVDYPFEGLARKAKAFGHVNIHPDPDGVVRYDRLLAGHDGLLYPSLSLRAAMRQNKVSISKLKTEKGKNGGDAMAMGDNLVPMDGSGRMAISYSPGVFPAYSFADVLAGNVDPDVFKDRTVLIGQDSSWTLRYEVTTGQSMSALEIRANAIENIINGRHIIRPGWAFAAECAIIIYFGIIASIILPRSRTSTAALVVLLSLAPIVIVSMALMATSGIWLMIYSPSAALALGFVLVGAKNYVIIGNRRELIREHTEANRMLGLELQSRGMLDNAFEKYAKCTLKDHAVKELLYNLAIDFERKRQPHKAARVYKHLITDGNFRDAAEKLAAMDAMEGSASSINIGAKRGDGTIVSDGTMTALPTLGRYEISRELGRGAMGIVYQGRDPKINREVAIKTLMYDEIEPDQLDEIKRRFFQEAEAAGKLSHPNILTIFDAGEEHDMAYLAMEVLLGVDLKDYCSKDKLLDVKEVLRISADVADALDYAHNNGVIHRDIKPANIMLLKDGTVKVTDFGIARVVESSKTQTGMVLGTPSYMSPEQVAGKKVDGRSDLFSLGATMYEMLAGQKAFTGDTITGIMYNITNSRYTPIAEVMPKLPGCIAAIVDKLLSKTITRRYKTGAEAVSDIRDCMKKIPG